MVRWIVALILVGVVAVVPLAGQVPAGNIEEVLSIGSLDGPLESTFSRIVGVEVASTGEILVADRAENAIRVFSPAGEFVRAFGRKGGGPAEFRSLATTAMLEDTLYALDWSLQKVAVFTLDGSLIWTRRINYSPGQHGLIYKMYPLRSGGLLMESGSGCYLPRRPGMDLQWWLHFLPPDGEDLVPVLREEIGRSVAVYGTEDDRFCTSFSFPFGTGPLIGVRPDGTIAFGTGENERVSFFQLSREDADSTVLGRAIAHLSLPGGRRSIGRDDRDEWLDQQIGRLPDGNFRSRRSSRVREVLEAVEFPEQWPAYDRLLFDAEGGVWVRRPPELKAEQASWEVYSSEGRYRGQIELPASLQVHRIRGDAVFGVVRDEWGVQYVKKYAVSWKR